MYLFVCLDGFIYLFVYLRIYLLGVKLKPFDKEIFLKQIHVHGSLQVNK